MRKIMPEMIMPHLKPATNVGALVSKEPKTATPAAAPTWRLVFKVAEAKPTWGRSTDANTTVVKGGKISGTPAPTHSKGKSKPQ